MGFRPNENEIKGSGWSILGFRLRDAFDLVAKRHAELILKFGGHEAAGLTIHGENFEAFCDSFEQAAQVLLTPADVTHVIETDGDLEASEINMQMAEKLTQKMWGQGFPHPTFNAYFYVDNQRIVGEKHLKLKLKKIACGDEKSNQQSDIIYDAILFFHIAKICNNKLEDFSRQTLFHELTSVSCIALR